VKLPRLTAGFICGLLMLGVTLTGSHARAELFTIEKFESDIQIDTSGTVEIVETLTVKFLRARHGIFRDIPFRYRSTEGSRVEMPLSIHGVENESGRERPYEVSREGNTIRVRIGSADAWVSGTQVYVIKYSVQNALLFLEDHDELYWNVTGNDWQAPIAAVLASVRINTQRSLGDIDAACYTGRYGSNRSECQWQPLDQGALFTSTESFEPGEGMTIAFGWPKGIVAPPSAWQKFWWRYQPQNNWPLLVPIITLIWMTMTWWRKGRDPKVREAITVQYRPPELDGKPMTAGEVGCLIDERLDQRDISAALVGLGVKGYLRIEDEADEAEYKLIRLKPADGRLTPFETKVMGLVFPSESNDVRVSDLRGEFVMNLPGLHRTLFDTLVRKGIFVSNPLTVKGRYGGLGVIVLLCTVLAGIYTANDTPVGAIAGALISGGIIFAFAGIMPAKTRKGARARADILGFQEFMRRADKDRIERLGPSVFYEFMPYAIALGVTDQWAKAFDGLLSSPPDWYVSHAGFPHFSSMMFARSLTTATSSIDRIVYSAPRGSGLSGGGFSGGGGGGGGFSGGGGGGGGGGSW
jgi:hypothetical protein